MRRYVVIVLSIVAAIIGCSVTLSLALDPYRIVHPLLGEFVFEPNSRVPKLEYLMRACSQYDSYYVGDSRSATLSERDLPAVNGRRFYNLSTPADDIQAIDRRMQFLLSRGCPVSTLIVGESIDVLLDPGDIRQHGLLLSEDPRISGEYWIAFYSRYFLSAQSLTTYFDARRRDPLTHDVYFPDGHADYLWAMRDGSSFLLPRCGVPALSAQARALLSDRLAAYRRIASLSEHYHFTTVVWIAPLNRWESGLRDDPDIVDFLRRLRTIPDLKVVEPDWNSPMLSDFREWHDCGHFRRSVFDQLLAPQILEILAAGAS